MSESRLLGTVAIIGVGLIGGSMGLAMKRYRLADRIIGIGRNEKTLVLAKGVAAVDDYTLDMKAGVADADLVVVSTPVRSIVPIVKTIAPFLKEGAVVTDVGSTKREVVCSCDKLMHSGTFFVGGHPMTGSEKTGVGAAFPDLFRNTTYILTPSDSTSITALSKTSELVAALGARLEIMSPLEHDCAVAATSHLPHVLAATLLHTANDISKTYGKLVHLTAGSFKDLTRISDSSTEMWRDICLTNTDSLVDTIDEFQSYLDTFKDLLKREDERALESFFKEAKTIRTFLKKD